MTEKTATFFSDEFNVDVKKGMSELRKEGHDIEKLIDPKNSQKFSDELYKMVERNSSM